MENQKKTRVEESIKLSMNLIRTMLTEPYEPLKERDYALIETCFNMVADGSRLDEWERQSSYKSKPDYYEVNQN